MHNLRINNGIAALHYLMYAFNGLVILWLAAFMGITQWKIQLSMSARSFLDPLTAVPWSGPRIFLTALVAFCSLLFLSWLYRQGRWKNSRWKYVILFGEICFCVMVMRSINMAYDGVVLLVAADLVHGYEGRQQRVLLLLAMLGLYLIANYSLAALQLGMVPLNAYISYYEPALQGLLVFAGTGVVLWLIALLLLQKRDA